MRWVALGIILLSIPLFAAYLTGGERRRDHLLMLLGLAMFLAGKIQFDAAIISWPLWEGSFAAAPLLGRSTSGS